MSTLILNGSPKGTKGNTHIFIQQFLMDMEKPCQVRCVAGTEPKQLAQTAAAFDTVLIFMPMYVHAMPGQVMKLLEEWKPAKRGQSLGFVVQYGFMEGQQSEWCRAALSGIARRLGYADLGTVIHGGSAGVSVMPENMNRKLFGSLRRLGWYFERYQAFDPQIVGSLAMPYSLSKAQQYFYHVLGKIGIGNMYWNQMLKANGAYKNRKDTPFAPEA